MSLTVTTHSIKSASNTSDVIIRKALPQDAQGIGYVHYHAWLETYTGLIDSEYLKTLSVQRSTKIFESTECRDVFVAVEDGKIVGFCGYCKARDEDLPDDCGEIYGIYILKAYQKGGAGRKLLDSALSELESNGFKNAVLWVLDTNKNAIDFYEHSGFVFDGAEKEEILVTSIREKRYVKKL